MKIVRKPGPVMNVISDLKNTVRHQPINQPLILDGETYNNVHTKVCRHATYHVICSDKSFYVVIERKKKPVYSYSTSRGIFGYRKNSLEECMEYLSRFWSIEQHLSLEEANLRKPRTATVLVPHKTKFAGTRLVNRDGRVHEITRYVRQSAEALNVKRSCLYDLITGKRRSDLDGWSLDVRSL